MTEKDVISSCIQKNIIIKQEKFSNKVMGFKFVVDSTKYLVVNLSYTNIGIDNVIDMIHNFESL